MNTIDEVSTITARPFCRMQKFQLRDKFVGENVIGIQSEHPGCGYAGFFQTKVPLTPVGIKCPLVDSHLREPGSYFQCFIITETVHQNDIARPAKSLQGPPNVWSFVVGQN